MNGYGTQAVKHAKSLLEDWHDQHYWKSKKAKTQSELQPENENLAEFSS